MSNHEIRYSTTELEKYIRSMYEKLVPLAKRDGVYRELDSYFDTGTPKGQDGGFCFSDEKGYHCCILERGNLIENIVTKSLSEITYQVISDGIFWMAMNYERAHRVENQDSRRLLFEKEMQYWEILGGDLAAIAKLKIEEILQEAPFVD